MALLEARRPRRRRCGPARWTCSPGWRAPRPPRTAPAADEVHFHEVGALDSLADVVGASAGAARARHRRRRSRSPVAVGSGMVRSAHGVLPVPVPAVARPAAGGRGAGARRATWTHEVCTPTGAALLASVVSVVGRRCRRCASTRSAPAPAAATTSGCPTCCACVLGEPGGAARPTAGRSTRPSCSRPTSTTSTRGCGRRCSPRLLAAGASDAWLTPILMKKGRPAHTLSVLTPPERADAVRAVVFAESSTIGLREHRVGKHALDREMSHGRRRRRARCG